MGVGCETFFKPAIKLEKNITNHLPVVDFPRCWGWCLVVGDVFQTFPH